MIKGRCKKCGKTLHIEEEITDLTCMYCGAKLRSQDLLPADVECDPKAADSHFSYAERHIVDCVIKQRGILQHFNRLEYIPSFSKYIAACGKVFDELNTAAILDMSRRDEFIRTLIDKLISGLEADWQTDPKWSKKKNQNEIIDRDKMVIAIYLVPMVGKLGYSVSDDFNNTLQKIWVEKYPKHIFRVGSYDKIISSYEAKLKLCFITTAVCENSGKPDDCYELTTLRSFRDNWLAFTPGGTELIHEYYNIAPCLVTCMELTDRDYQGINDKYIRPCIADIENGDMASCRDRYVEMVRNLKRKYLA